MKLVIVDYGMGNIHSIIGALHFIGVHNISVTDDHEEITNADKLILPGAGAFGKAMEQIKAKKLDLLLHEVVMSKKKPILGICLGMQLMGMLSYEHGIHEGLKLMNGVVKKIKKSGNKIPHVGFNQVIIDTDLKLYKDFKINEPDFYFTHSLSMHSEKNVNQSSCSYGEPFMASFEIENIAGVQFHPELSQHNGLRLYKNFIELF